jgi:transposase
MMHGEKNIKNLHNNSVKFVNAPPKNIYTKYKNIKEKLYKTNTAI